MKRISAIICTLALLAGLTGCDNGRALVGIPESGVSAPESVGGDPESIDNVSSADSSDISESLPESADSVPEQRLSDEQLEMIAGLTMQSFVGPDGETVLMTDAVDAVNDNGERAYDQTVETLEMVTWVDTMLTFDFAYIRYARPYFYAGRYIEDEEREPLSEMEWFKVREGDNLDCGLIVKKAQLDMFPVLGWENSTYLQTIELDGEITLEGMLFATTNTNDYASKVGDLNFFPDPTKTEGVPVVRRDYDKDEAWYNLNRCLYPGADPEYFETDASPTWYIGNIDDDNFDESSIFGGDRLVRVKTTLKNVKLDVFDEIAGGGFGGAKITAEIVDIRRVE